VKMFEPKPAAGLPEEVPFSLVGPLQFSDAALRTYGHPELLRVAAAINGEDFVPFNEAVIVKKPGMGASFAWHQDGMTHWNHPDWDPMIHGFNFMVQLYGSTAANGMWYVPGSHRTGKADLKTMIGRTGQLLPDAVPMISQPGDVAISNRQIIHGSFPNMSAEQRITLNMGFHRRRSVENVETFSMFGEPQRYDEAWLDERAALIGYGISARRQRFPDETPFVYRPHAEAGAHYEWNDDSRRAINEYHRLDLLI
jgi:ectoine hydroxylase-related dioxygenase (phytanoyl-CoA dioxygenase family)